MKRSLALYLAVLMAPALAGAHEGHKHQLMGTIGGIDQDRLEVKDAEGRSTQLVLTDKTAILRGTKSIPRTDLKVGERVVAEYEQTGNTLTAQSLRVADPAAQAAARYSCPMHPEVKSDQPGKCPKCGMHLEPVAKGQPSPPRHH